MFELVDFLIILIGDESLHFDFLFRLRVTGCRVHEEWAFIIVYKIIILIFVLDFEALSLFEVELLIVVILS